MKISFVCLWFRQKIAYRSNDSIDDRLKLSSIDNAVRNESFTLEYSRHLKLWY